MWGLNLHVPAPRPGLSSLCQDEKGGGGTPEQDVGRSFWEGARDGGNRMSLAEGARPWSLLAWHLLCALTLRVHRGLRCGTCSTRLSLNNGCPCRSMSPLPQVPLAPPQSPSARPPWPPAAFVYFRIFPHTWFGPVLQATRSLGLSPSVGVAGPLSLRQLSSDVLEFGCVCSS